MLSAVAEEYDDGSATTKPADAAAGESSAAAAKSVQSTPVPGKRTLKNVKTMFYVGTEVSLLIIIMH